MIKLTKNERLLNMFIALKVRKENNLDYVEMMVKEVEKVIGRISDVVVTEDPFGLTFTQDRRKYQLILQSKSERNGSFLASWFEFKELDKPTIGDPIWQNHNVGLVYTTDSHHSKNSRELRGIFTTSTTLEIAISKLVQELGLDEIDVFEELKNNLQTQGYDTNILIEIEDMNTILWK